MRRKPDVVDAEWRPVRPAAKKGDVLFHAVLAFSLLAAAVVCFWVSGVPQWWEFARHGRETTATVVDLDFKTSTVRGSSSSFNLLKVTFRDEQGRLHKAEITDVGRFAFDHRINPHNPRPSLPKAAPIIYSSLDPSIAELRDYRNHSWWMFAFSILVAACSPAFFFLARREARHAAGPGVR